MGEATTAAPTSPPERDFWNTAPVYPVESGLPSLVAQLAPRSRLRSVAAHVLFVTVFAGVVMLLLCEVSIRLDLPWLDPRVAIANLLRFASSIVGARRSGLSRDDLGRCTDRQTRE